ncbi:MAG: DNA polymerase IV [Patescibacteria group bacterium]
MHLDMNSYFASVEQQANPLLRGKALGVCAYLHEYGCIIAASIEAKARGMKVGMRVKEARQLIPDAVFVQNDPAKYRTVTSQVFAILHDLSDRVEHYSIDEAFLDCTGWMRDEAEAAWMAVKTRERIRREVGEWLRCSIGIAPTRFLAKLASDREKPSGLTIITLENLDSILLGMSLQDVYGIGRRMKKRIDALGYHTPLELKRAPVANLMQAFGIEGYLLWARLNGIQADALASNDAPPKSIGHSYCLPMRVNREGRVRATLVKLAERAARRLRRQNLYAKSVLVSIAFRDSTASYAPSPFGPPTDGVYQHRFDEPVNDSYALVHAVLKLFDDLWDGHRAISFLAVTYTEFTPPSHQMHLCLFRPTTYNLRPTNSGLSFALDVVNDRYGDHSVIFGSMFGITKDEAPDRIGFRKTDGVDITNFSLG